MIVLYSHPITIQVTTPYPENKLISQAVVKYTENGGWSLVTDDEDLKDA